MPVAFSRVEFALAELVIPVFGRGFRIEEAHERAVGDERDDPFGLVIPKFQAADPDEDHEDSDTHQADAQFPAAGSQSQRTDVKFFEFRHHHFSFEV